MLSKVEDIEVVSYPSGGGSLRGIHNCGLCDREMKKALDEYNVNKDPSVFSKLECSCKKEWSKLNELESSSMNVQLHYKSQNRDW